jgi:hypothetical protein
MAIAAVTAASIGTYTFRYTWASMANADSGAPVDVTDLADLTFQCIGPTFGAGGTIILEGSLDGGTTYFPLKDPSSTAISLTAAGGRAVLEHTPHVRPRVTGGDGSTALVAILMARRVGR